MNKEDCKGLSWRMAKDDIFERHLDEDTIEKPLWPVTKVPETDTEYVAYLKKRPREEFRREYFCEWPKEDYKNVKDT